VHGGRPHGVPFLEAQGPVVHAGGQAEAVFGEGRLAAEVAAVHAADLRDRDVALVREHEGVVGQVLEQRRRRLAGLAAGEVARIVLDPRAGARRLDHLEVEGAALLEALRLEEAAHAGELVDAQPQLLLDALDGLLQGRARRHVVGVGVDLHELQVVRLLAGEGIELDDRFDLVAEQADPPGAVLEVGREELDHVAAHPEGAAREVTLDALVLERHEVGDELALLDALADLHRERHRRVGLDRPDAVDARHGGHDDDVVALEERAGRRVAHAVDLLVDRGFLLDVGVRARDVRLGLVIVVVGHEVLDGVVGKEALELAVELRREGLVRREDQGRALRLLDHLRHREGLARAGDAEQDLVALLAADAVDELGDRLRLVARRLEVGLDPERDAALGLLRPRRPVRHPGLAVLEARVALGEEPRQGLDGGRDAVGRDRAGVRRVRAVVGAPHAEALRERRVEVGEVAVGVILRPLGEARRLRALPVDGGAEEVRQVGVEGLQLGLRRLAGRELRLAAVLAARRAGGLFG
jgi:hypothetical protein